MCWQIMAQPIEAKRNGVTAPNYNLNQFWTHCQELLIFLQKVESAKVDYKPWLYLP